MNLADAIKQKKQEEAKKRGDLSAFLLEFQSQMQSTFDRLEEKKKELADFVENSEESMKELKKNLLEKIEDHLEGITQPDDGETPTDERILALIKSVMPPLPKDGETPSDKRLLGLIKPLIKIPKVKDGKTPTNEELLYLIEPVVKSLMPEIKGLKPDSPLEIAEKLNTLQEKVDWTVIKGLKDKFATMMRAIKEKTGGSPKGGGMGSVVHQTIDLTSASTSFTCSSKVAANGYAIWATYEGANIVRGTAYTMGSDRKTVTLLFTPEDNTHIDLIFIRA